MTCVSRDPEDADLLIQACKVPSARLLRIIKPQEALSTLLGNAAFTPPPPAGGDGDSQQQSYTWEVGGERKPGSSSEDGPSQTDRKGEQHSQAMRT